MSLIGRSCERGTGGGRFRIVRSASLLAFALLVGGSAAASSYTYDALGRLTQVTEADGSWIQYTYDANGNVTSISSSGSTAPVPVSIASFSPAAGPVGTPVTINGAGFAAVPSQNGVTFNGVAATVLSSTVTSLVAAVPAGATTGPVSVSNSNGTATSGSSFTVSQVSISGFTPAIGAAGTTVTISGAGFDPTPANNTVKINNATATVTSATGTQLQITVPLSATTGRISVTDTAGTALSATDFVAPPVSIPPSSIALDGQLLANATGLVYDLDRSNTVGAAFFDGTQGQEAAVVISNVSMGGTYTIYAPDGTVVSTGNVVPGAIRFGSLPQTGTYSIYLSPGTALGSATVHVVSDATGNLSTAGGGVATTLLPGQNASYTFTGVANQPYSLSLGTFASNPANGSLTATILKPDGTTLVSCGSYYAGYGNCDFTIPVAGIYTLSLVPAGVYSISFTLYFSANATATLTAGTPTSLPLVAGQHGTLSFASGSGATYALYFAPLTGVPSGTTVTLKVYQPNGTLVGTGSISTTSSYTYNLTGLSAGTYTALITPSGNAAATVQATLANGLTGTLSANGTQNPITATVPGQNGYFSFSGTAGQNLAFAVTGISLTPSSANLLYVTLYRPDGVSFASTSCYSSSVPGCGINLLNLPQTGTYTVLVTTAAQVMFSATITLSTDVSGALTAGSPSSINLSAPGQEAWLTFTATAGQTVAINVGSVLTTPSNGTVYALIYNSSGTQIGSLNATPSASGTVNLPNLAAGSYSVLIYANAAATGSMQVTLASGVGGSIPSNGTTVAASTTVPGQNGYFSFSGTAGQSLGLGLTSLSTSPVGVSLYIYVYRPDGVMMTSSTCYSSTVPGCQLSLQNLPQTGTYSLVVTPSTQATFNASLTLSTDITATLAINTPLSLNLCLPGENALVTYVATAGQTAAVNLGSVVTTPSGGTVTISVTDPNGSAAGSASSTATASGTVNLTSMLAGTYTTLVSAQNGSACTAQVTFATGLTGSLPSDGTTHAEAATVPGQNGYFTFSGTAGQSLGLGITSLSLTPSTSNYAYFYVYRPDGVMLTSAVCYMTSTPGCQVNLQNLPQTGTYKITLIPPASETVSTSLTLSQDTGGTLTLGTPLGVTFASPGQIALPTFTATSGQSVTLTTSSQSTTPTNTSIAVSVYNASGNVIASGSSTTGTTLNLTSLPAGTYSVWVSPVNAATGSAQVKIQ